MGDVIQVLDEFTIHRCERDDGKEHTFEICVIYPDYLKKDNFVIDCEDEDDSSELFIKIMQNSHRAIHDHLDT